MKTVEGRATVDGVEFMFLATLSENGRNDRIDVSPIDESAFDFDNADWEHIEECCLEIVWERENIFDF